MKAILLPVAGPLLGSGLRKTSSRKIGRTLFELLAVLGMIATLAGIAVPNFLEAQVRSKIARAHIDMAAISIAAQAYRTDYSAYPPNPPEVEKYLVALSALPPNSIIPESLNAGNFGGETTSVTKSGLPLKQTQFSQSKADGSVAWVLLRNQTSYQYALTTPVAYLDGTKNDSFSNYRVDPMERPTLLRGYDLSRLPKDTITSAYGFAAPFVIASHGPALSWGLNVNLLRGEGFSIYDATNGTVSSGLILRVGNAPIPTRVGQ